MVGKTILASGNSLARRARFGLVALAATALVATATVLPAAATTTTPVQVVGPPSALRSVACSTPTTCYAVGFGVGGEITPITNGVAGPPTAFPNYGFYDVVCPSATTCVVYGGYTRPGIPDPINQPRGSYPTQPKRLVITNGVIGPPEDIPYALRQVACFDATYCVGLTTALDGTTLRQAVVVIVNGIFGPPQFFPAEVESLSDVACASATTCFAVGQTPEVYPDFTFPDFVLQAIGAVVPIVNGVLGAVQVVPVANSLNGVACASATTCYAVGYNRDLFKPQGLVVPIVNGTAGTAVAAPSVDALGKIACLTAAICEALSVDRDGQAVVVPIINGIPGPAHVVTGAPSLDDVACSAPICVAIGSTYQNQTQNYVSVVTVITEPELMCNAKLATVVGTAGADRLFGTSGPDVVLSLGGNDSIYTYGGDDTICAGDGNDVVYGGAGNDFVDGGAGNDTIIGDAGNDVLQGGDGSDRLFASAGIDQLDGGPAVDYCYKGTGTTTFTACEVFPAGM